MKDIIVGLIDFSENGYIYAGIWIGEVLMNQINLKKSLTKILAQSDNTIFQKYYFSESNL